MGKEGKGGHLKEAWWQFLGQQWWRQRGAAGAAKGDALAKGEKRNQRVFSDTEGARKHSGEREAEQEKRGAGLTSASPRCTVLPLNDT